MTENLLSLFVFVKDEHIQLFKDAFVDTDNDQYYNKIVFLGSTGEIYTHGKIYGVGEFSSDMLDLLVNELLIPTKTSQLINDSNYVKGSDIPTKVSQLTNDSGYAKTSAIPSKVSQLTNDAKYVKLEEVDLSSFLLNTTFNEYLPIINNAVNKASLATINGKSIVNGGKDITFDTNVFEIVESLPTTDISRNKIYIMIETIDNKLVANQYSWNGSTWSNLGPTTANVDMSKYLTIEDAKNTYMLKSGSSSGGATATGAALSISTSGSFNNYGDNGQAFNAVRNLPESSTSATRTAWQKGIGSGFPINAASFGVKSDGNTAFSHKKYDSFNKDTGVATGAKNTAVLVFSGKAGLLYAKNTGTANDVTEAMYKFVGVIDSPDDRQKVYSASLVDGITNALEQRITDLEGQNEYLMNVISLLIEKTGVTDAELAEATGGIIAQQSLSDIDDDVQNNIQNNTLDYSSWSNEESGDEHNV